MDIQTRFLPIITRQHLFNISVNRGNAVSESFIQNPLGGTAGDKRKFGWQANLPAGGGGAGRDRLLRLIYGGRTTWWKAHHVGDNSYTFDKIVLPKCGACDGTGEPVCHTCGGGGKTGPAPATGVFTQQAQCPTCRGAGYTACATCSPPNTPGRPVIVDGYTVNPNLAAWG